MIGPLWAKQNLRTEAYRCINPSTSWCCQNQVVIKKKKKTAPENKKLQFTNMASGSQKCTFKI